MKNTLFIPKGAEGFPISSGAGLLLAPRTPQHERRLLVNCTPSRDYLKYPVWNLNFNDCTFSAFRNGILPNLRRLNLPQLTSSFRRLDKYFESLDSAGPEVSGSHDPHLALRRRLSREAGPFTRIVELGANLFNDVVQHGDLPGVILDDLERADAATIILLARATLLRPSPFKQVVLQSRSLPDPDAKTPRERFYALALRRALLAGKIEVLGKAAWPYHPPAFQGPSSLYEATLALLQHNYPRAIHICSDLLLNTAGEDEARVHAVMGIAKTSLGVFDEASEAFGLAAQCSPAPCTKAHAYYLRALLATKRLRDLGASDRFLSEGFKALDYSDEDDANLERAWLTNGRALNCATTYKSSGNIADWQKAWDYQRGALTLVSSIKTPEAAYLQYNLAANLSLLCSLHPDRNVQRAGAKHFDLHFQSVKDNSALAATSFNYRSAMCSLIAGDVSEAGNLLSNLPLKDLHTEDWPLLQNCYYTMGVVAKAQGNFSNAIDHFELSARLSIGGRAKQPLLRALAAIRHANGGVLTASGGRIAEDEQLQVTDLEGISLKPSPKLPAYYPEVDLEEIPAINFNCFLLQ